MQGYDDAFRVLLYILAAITVASAALVFGLLSRSRLPHLPGSAPQAVR
ncbi:hypothetical protein RR42_m4142 [Cupriavidus basilensis]|uniref:Uncharacterized protein n=1 Tax=Cupriavidus basilensis TaxID=68895 RepID=A0A0C4YFF1_9BURK|nr:hypothetical protein RR42_m4142 [Cupriavidus basilensis]